MCGLPRDQYSHHQLLLRRRRPDAQQLLQQADGAPGSITSEFTAAINNAGYALATAPTAQYKVGWVVDTTLGSNATTYDRDVPPIVTSGTDVPMGLNNNASPMVVGYASTGSDGSGKHASIWTYGAATSTDLNTYAAGLGAANLTGWVFQEADSINNGGEIVGYGTLNGVNHAFALLTVPEPSALLLAASGLIGLLAYAWRKRR